MSSTQNLAPPPPPDFPPPAQTRRSKQGRSRSGGKTKTATRAQEQQQTQSSTVATNHDNNAASGSAALPTGGRPPIHAMEIENSIPLPDARMSLFPRMPWSKQPYDDNRDGIIDNGLSFGSQSGEAGLYYGDIMSSYGVGDTVRYNLSTESVAGSHVSGFQLLRDTRSGFMQGSSSNSRSNLDNHNDDHSVESLNDFQDWTPADSAYGAAFPICGCLPKRIRRAIEVTLIGLSVFLLVYVVITTSMRITNDHGGGSVSSSSGESSNKLADDDFYIEHSYDDKYYDAARQDDDKEDDYFREMDDAIDAGDDAFGDDAVAAGDDAVDANNDDVGGGRQFLRLF